MNNMKYYTNNLAYDYEMFLPKEKRQDDLSTPKAPDNIVNMPRVSGKAGAVRIKREQRKNRAFAIITTILVLMMLSCNIFFRAMVTEVQSQINSAKKELNELQSESTMLEMQFEQKISFSNIEQAAVELGMQKKDRTQVNYITTTGESWAQVGGSNTAEKK